MNAPTVASIVVPLVGSLILLVGYQFSRTGKKADQAQEAVKSQFDRLMAENTYVSGQLKQTREEWESRWDRQMNRCRKVTDAATQAITDLIRYVPPDKRRIGDRTLDEIEHHREDDHPENP